MATRKSDADVGPIGAWAYDARTSLKGSDGKELQPEDVAPLLPKPPHPATIRRIESNPNYNPEKMVRDLYAIYRRMGDQQGVFVPPPPLGDRASTPLDQGALVIAIRDLVEQMRLDREERTRATREQARWNRGVEKAIAKLGDRIHEAPKGGPASPPRADVPQ